MTVAAALLLYVVTVMAAGPKLLPRIASGRTAPRLAVTAWITAVVTVVGCAVAASALLIVEAAGHWDDGDAILMSCLERLQVVLAGGAGATAQAVAIAAVTMAVGTFTAIGVRVVHTLRRMRAHTFEHADAVRLVGRSGGSDIVIIDSSEPAAYCVAGRPPAIVVTSAAVAALDKPSVRLVAGDFS